jgi:hypothetical protein
LHSAFFWGVFPKLADENWRGFRPFFSHLFVGLSSPKEVKDGPKFALAFVLFCAACFEP